MSGSPCCGQKTKFLPMCSNQTSPVATGKEPDRGGQSRQLRHLSFYFGTLSSLLINKVIEIKIDSIAVLKVGDRNQI